ncbi:MAG TPA: hypothetical protein P5556_00355 [Candidatus Gastranaerophilales bacterium]|nr:hypothetical protein [Candidatus Gastranaerophilales bacterium]
MITGMLNMMNSVFQTSPAIAPKVMPKSIAENPFASPFVGKSFSEQLFEGKNQPVKGGFFAGYYNGKKNIVGQKLFINV